ncbi:MAG: hypothetical protein AAF715_25040 [Myxococcota bacterium]
MLALQNNWRCSGTDGMCSPDNAPANEVPVPGALCRGLDNGNLPNRCTYACPGPLQCPLIAGTDTCGDGTPPQGPPNWVGG